jgi:gas vesicle protein
MLLLAPQSGKRTRAKIQQTGIELRDQTNDAVEDAMAQAGIKARQIRTGASKQVKVLEQQGQAVIDESKKRLSTIVEAGKTTVKGTPA